MTPKQRFKHYEEALRMLKKGNPYEHFHHMSNNWFLNNSGICELLSLSAYGDLKDLKKGNFPEFDLFQPTYRERIKEQKESKTEKSSFWWAEDNRTVREVVLLLCIQMVKEEFKFLM